MPALLGALLLAAAGSAALPRSFAVPPILMYHRVDVDRPRDAIGRDLTVSPASFALQLQILRQLHLQLITMNELDRRLLRHEPLSGVAVLTFDDGYADQAKYAVPLLRQIGARATFYIVTGTLGTPNHLTWRDLQRLTALRMDIGGHGLTHDDLSLMNAQEQRAQIAGCTRLLRRRLHVPVASYAYPSGRLNAQTLRIVPASGIDLAVTTDPQYVIAPASRFELTRVRVHGAWTGADFRAAIRAALAAPQRVRR